MAPTTFFDFYKSDFQAVYALWVVPLGLLAYLLFGPARSVVRSGDAFARFLFVYCVVFAFETILDPFATGPLLRALGVEGSALGTAIPLVFVLLGDFRVYLLLFASIRLSRVTHPASEPSLAPAFAEAAAWTLVVPIVAFAGDRALHALRPGLPEQTIWLVYELAFLAMAVWLRTVVLARRLGDSDEPLRRGLEAVAAYVAVYYALWATADVVILVLGLDAGWALRVIPNQLYYAFFLPFVYLRLSPRR